MMIKRQTNTKQSRSTIAETSQEANYPIIFVDILAVFNWHGDYPSDEAALPQTEPNRLVASERCLLLMLPAVCRK